MSMNKGSRITLPVIGTWGDCRLGDWALEGFESITEGCKCYGLVLEVVSQLVKVGEEASENISVL
jgi:hypothetical protein